MMGGKALSKRRFDGDMCTGIPTVQKMRDSWGDCLECLPMECKKIHIKKGVFHYGNKKQITPDEAIYELGVVSYPGTGKYNDTNIYVPYHELPDSLDVATKEQMKISSPPGQGWWPVIALRKELYDPWDATKQRILIVC